MRALPRILAGLALVAGLAGAASAQTVGVKGGWVHPTFGAADTENVKAMNTVGGGVFAAVPLTPLLALQVEALYLPKGSKSTMGEVSGSLKIDYIEVPLLLRLNVPLQTMSIKPGVFAGPHIAFKTRCRVEAQGGGMSVSAKCGEGTIKSTDYGMTFGGGVDFPLTPRLSGLVEARYDLGLTTVDAGDNPDDVKNRALMVFAGLSMPLGGARGATSRTH